MIYIPIGNTCKTAEFLIKNNLRHRAYPYDWIFSSLDVVSHSIKDRFKTFLDKECLYDVSSERAKHSFYNQMIKNDKSLRQHFNECTFCYYPPDYECSFFNHHNLQDEKIYEAFIRRCDRFLNDFENNECCLVYTNGKQDNTDEIIEFYKNNLEEKENIHMLAIVKGDEKNIFNRYKRLNIIYKDEE